MPTKPNKEAEVERPQTPKDDQHADKAGRYESPHQSPPLIIAGAAYAQNGLSPNVKVPTTSSDTSSFFQARRVHLGSSPSFHVADQLAQLAHL